MASDLTVKQVQEAQEYKGSLKCGFVVSRKIGNTVIGRQIRVMAAEDGMPILVAEVGNRVPFAESLTMGQSIFEWAPKSVAAHEIQSLTREILSYGEEKLRNRAPSRLNSRQMDRSPHMSVGALATTPPPPQTTRRQGPNPPNVLSLDLPLSLHTRFKTACSATRSNMAAEIQAFIKTRTAILEKEAGIDATGR